MDANTSARILFFFNENEDAWLSESKISRYSIIAPENYEAHCNLHWAPCSERQKPGIPTDFAVFSCLAIPRSSVEKQTVRNLVKLEVQINCVEKLLGSFRERKQKRRSIVFKKRREFYKLYSGTALSVAKIKVLRSLLCIVASWKARKTRQKWPDMGSPRFWLELIHSFYHLFLNWTFVPLVNDQATSEEHLLLNVKFFCVGIRCARKQPWASKALNGALRE